MKVLILIFCLVALSETTVAENSVQSLKSRTHSFCLQILNYFSGGKAIEESPRLTYRKQIMSQKLPRFKDIFNEEKYAVPAGRDLVHLFMQRHQRPISTEEWIVFMRVTMTMGVDYIQAKWPSISQRGQIWTYLNDQPNNDWAGVAMTIRDEYRFFDLKNKKHAALWRHWSSSNEAESCYNRFSPAQVAGLASLNLPSHSCFYDKYLLAGNMLPPFDEEKPEWVVRGVVDFQAVQSMRLRRHFRDPSDEYKVNFTEKP